MSKHTPGPWVVKKTRDIWPDSKSAGVSVCKERGTYEWKGKTEEANTYICHIPDNPRAQYQANARLIACAPEMLEILRAVVFGFIDPSKGDEYRALLKKAEGK